MASFVFEFENIYGKLFSFKFWNNSQGGEAEAEPPEVRTSVRHLLILSRSPCRFLQALL